MLAQDCCYRIGWAKRAPFAHQFHKWLASWVNGVRTPLDSDCGRRPLSATWKAAENDCLERRNSIRPCVPSHVAYKAERGGNELFWSPWKMYPRSQERRRNREATVYLPALGGDGPRLDRTIRIYKCSQASSAEESLKGCAALLAVSTEA